MTTKAFKPFKSATTVRELKMALANLPNDMPVTGLCNRRAVSVRYEEDKKTGEQWIAVGTSGL